MKYKFIDSGYLQGKEELHVMILEDEEGKRCWIGTDEDYNPVVGEKISDEEYEIDSESVEYFYAYKSYEQRKTIIAIVDKEKSDEK